MFLAFFQIAKVMWFQ